MKLVFWHISWVTTETILNLSRILVNPYETYGEWFFLVCEQEEINDENFNRTFANKQHVYWQIEKNLALLQMKTDDKLSTEKNAKFTEVSFKDYDGRPLKILKLLGYT